MFQYKCLNPISQTGLGLFGEEYKQTEDMNNADAVLVRSAKMHDMELPENVKVIARAGAGVNNIPVDACQKKVLLYLIHREQMQMVSKSLSLQVCFLLPVILSVVLNG